MTEPVTQPIAVPGSDLEVTVSLEKGELTMVLTKANLACIAWSSNRQRCRSRTRGSPTCSCTIIACH
jgi:hypothetical protein